MSRETNGWGVLEEICMVGGKQRPERGEAEGSWEKRRRRRSEPMVRRWVPSVGWSHFA
jgi:hypothetical protein